MDRYYTKRLMGYYIKDLYEITYVDGEEYTS